LFAAVLRRSKQEGHRADTGAGGTESGHRVSCLARSEGWERIRTQQAWRSESCSSQGRLGTLQGSGSRRPSTRSHVRQQALLQRGAFACCHCAGEFTGPNEQQYGRPQCAAPELREVRWSVQQASERCPVLPSMPGCSQSRLSALAACRTEGRQGRRQAKRHS